MIVAIAHAAALLRDAHVVAYPTETVYGLGADPSSPRALGALRALKGREPGRGESLLVADLELLESCVGPLPEPARALARRFWPGPLTLVVPVDRPELAAVATERGVGFRCSPHPTASALAREARRPIAATSCNPSGGAPCRNADEVERAFGRSLAIAGGEPAGGLEPSTVVAVDRAGRLELLRPGALAEREIREALP